MDLRVLRYFVAVAERGSVAGAAKVLHIAQPALSRHMNALEEELGIALFLRKPRGMVLTREGAELKAHATDLLSRASNIKTHIAQTASGRAGMLRLGLLGGYSWLPLLGHTIREIGHVAPDVGILIGGGPSLQQLEAVKQGKLDAAVAAWRSPLDASLTSLQVYRDRMAVAMPADCPVAKKADLALSDLLDQRFIMFPREKSPAHFDGVVGILKSAGVLKQSLSLVGPDTPTILGLVATGLGCAVVPASYATQPSIGVVIRSVQDLDLAFDIELVWRTDNQDALLHKFVDVWSSLGQWQQSEVVKLSERT